MKIFKDRQSAGKLLVKHLKKYKGMEDILVLTIPRGGVVVAHEVAKALKLPLDVLVTRKIGAPYQPELALGAIDPDGEVVWDDKLVFELGVKTEDLKQTIREELDELARRESVYRQGKEPLDVDSKTVVLVDDGIATGATILAATNYLKRHKVKRIILAVPVASKEAGSKLSEVVDELIILETPDYFQAVGQFYQHFDPVEDEVVVEILRLAPLAQDDNKD